MIEQFSKTADPLFIVLYIISLVLFFFFGPHKVYESVLWSIIAIGLYFLIQETTSTYSLTSQSFLWWEFLIENRLFLLRICKMWTFALLIATPITLWINVFWIRRNIYWYILKTIILSIFYILYLISIFIFLFPLEWILWEVSVFPKYIIENEFFTESHIYSFVYQNRIFILLLAYVICIYKVIFSHWMSSIFLIGWTMYYKWVQFFRKKDDNDFIPENSHDDEEVQ